MCLLNKADWRARIRWQLARGMLPIRAEGQRVYVGYGPNRLCDGCGRHILASDVLVRRRFRIEWGAAAKPAASRA